MLSYTHFLQRTRETITDNSEIVFRQCELKVSYLAGSDAACCASYLWTLPLLLYRSQLRRISWHRHHKLIFWSHVTLKKGKAMNLFSC